METVCAHLPWKSRLSSLQALMETSAEVECLFIISTRLTWRPLDSSREHILPAVTEPTFTVRANRTVFRKELNLQIIR